MENINDNLILWWQMNGNANDSSGSGFNGTLSNSPSLTTNQLNISNTAYSLNGTNQSIYSSGFTGHTNVPGYTVCYWYNPVLKLTRSRPITSITTSWVTGYYGNAGGSGTNFAWYVGNGTSYSGGNMAASFVTFGSWQFVCITYDKTTGKLYKNGIQVATQSYSSATINISSGISLGATIVASDLCEGNFGDLRIYNRALTDAEISSLYTATVGNHTINNLGVLSSSGYSNLGLNTNGLVLLIDGSTIDKTGINPTASTSGAVSYSSNSIYGNSIVFAGDLNYSLGTGTIAGMIIGNQPSLFFTQATDFSWTSTFTIDYLPPNNASGVFGSTFDNSITIAQSTGIMYVGLRGSTQVVVYIGTNYWQTRLGQVHTVGFTYKASETKFYVYLDGVLQNAGGTLGPATFSTNDWRLGDNSLNGGNTSSCGKTIYKCTVFNRQLSDSEHLQIANTQLGKLSLIKGSIYKNRFDSLNTLSPSVRMRDLKGNLITNGFNSL